MIPVLVGAMGLAVLDAVVSRQAAAENVGGWLETLANVVRDFLSPAVPAFNTSSASSSTTAAVAFQGASSSSSSTPPALSPGYGAGSQIAPPPAGYTQPAGTVLD